MQEIRYNVERSSFAERIEKAVRESKDLSRPVQVELDPGGINRDVTIEIRADDPEYFLTDWKGEPSWFSARLRAAATVLRDLRLPGTYRASHQDGILTLRRD